MERVEMRLSGFGGQGIILAGNIMGQAAAIYDKKHATFTQAYGPEARGGACSAQVVISDELGGYPYVENPSLVVAMSQEAYTKYAANVPQNVTVIIDEGLVKPNKAQEPRILKIPATRIAEDMGRGAVANIVMLGFVASVTDAVSLDALKKSILDSVPKGTEELNMKAFDRGYAHGKEQLKARGEGK